MPEQQTTDECGWEKCCGGDPRGCIQPGGDAPETEADPRGGIVALALCSVDVDALRHAVDALGALQRALIGARHGLAADHLENAAGEVRKAMRMMGA
jgi:hypothetical protein